MAAKKVLVVLTSHDKIDAINKQTGWYLVRCSTPPLLTMKNLNSILKHPH